MFNSFLLPGTTTVKETLLMYCEAVKEFIDEILYYIAKFELRL